MFAVIKTGGKQYRVAADDKITIEKLPAEAGSKVTFDEVLMVGDGDSATIGTPLVAGASVAGEIVEQTRGDKVRVFKKKRRKGYRRTAGHRQHLTVVKITDILADGAKMAKKAEAKPKADDKAETKTAEPAPAEAPAEKPAETPVEATAETPAEVTAEAPAEAKADPKADNA